jgi:hypothetical protein
MSSPVRHRTSRARTSVTGSIGSTPAQNLERFVEAGRICAAFGEIEFDARIWKVPTRTNMPGGSSIGELAFTVASTSRDPAATAMDERFASFLKAAVRLEDWKSPGRPRPLRGRRRRRPRPLPTLVFHLRPRALALGRRSVRSGLPLRGRRRPPASRQDPQRCRDRVAPDRVQEHRP